MVVDSELKVETSNGNNPLGKTIAAPGEQTQARIGFLRFELGA
jgi:hypothetical protein